MNFSCEDLGITKEEIIKRIVRQAADDLVNSTIDGFVVNSEDGEDIPAHLLLQTRVQNEFENVVGAAAREIVDDLAKKSVHAHIEGITFQKAKKWGEPAEEPRTLREQIEFQIDEFLNEKVNADGEAKREHQFGRGPYDTPRLSFLLSAHISGIVKDEVGKAVLDFRDRLGKGFTTMIHDVLISAANSSVAMIEKQKR